MAVAEGPQVKWVLILNSYGRDFSPVSSAAAAFQTELARKSPIPVSFIQVSLESLRTNPRSAESALLGYLQSLFRERAPDLIVPFGFPALEFLMRHRGRLLSKVPVVVGSVDKRRLDALPAGSDFTGAGVEVNLAQVIDNILRVLPDTQEIALVAGKSTVENYWRRELEKEFQRFAHKVRFTWLEEKSFAGILRRVANLPPKTAILYVMFLMDGVGVPYEQEAALSAVRQQANAPVFGAFDHQLGKGIVGGPLYSSQAVSLEAASIGMRILAGEAASKIPPVMLGAAPPVYDDRELRRWSISEQRLPPGSVVKFREPSLWRRYGGWVLSGLALIGVLVTLIVKLLLERDRRIATQLLQEERLRLEMLVSELSAKFVQLPAAEIDRQIVGSLGKVAQFLGFDFSSLSVFTGPAVGRVAFIWQAPGTPTMPTDLTEKDFPWLARELYAGRDVSYLSPDELPAEAEIDRATNRRIHNRSVHCVPLLADGTTLGVLNVGTFFREQGVSANSLRQLRLLGEVFANALARKRMEDALKADREFLRQVIDVDPNFIFAKDREGRFTLANQAVADVYGTTVEGLIGKTDADFNVNAREVEFFRQIDMEVMESRKEHFIANETVTDADGNLHYLQTVKRPLIERDGRVTQVLGSATDVTKRRELELESARQRDQLAHFERLSTMGELSTSLAHELNQPLTAILSNAQAAKRFLAANPIRLDEVGEILEDIIEDDRRAGEVIRKMRSLVKKEPLTLATIDLCAIVREVVNLLHGDAVMRNLQVNVEIGRDELPVRGDRVQLQQVLLNLLLNAFAATEDQPASRRDISVLCERDGSGMVRVAVIDRGHGLSGNTLDKIFEPFYTTKRDGLGMGLSISRSIVEAHGGRLWAENGVQGGAVFYFTVPEIDRQTELHFHG